MKCKHCDRESEITLNNEERVCVVCYNILRRLIESTIEDLKRNIIK